jgi:hypothetical protein
VATRCESKRQGGHFVAAHDQTNEDQEADHDVPRSAR